MCIRCDIVRYLLVFIVVQTLFSIGVYQYYIFKGDEEVNKHSRILSPALWAYNKESPLAYLKLVVEGRQYLSLEVLDKSENTFIIIDNMQLSSFEIILLKYSLVPINNIEASVFHNQLNIGRIKIISPMWGFIYFSFQFSGVFILLLSALRFFFEMKRSKVEAECANNEKSKFLSRMSHELRTPLNAIMGFGQIFALDFRGVLNKEEKDNIQQILHSGEHLIQLINGILDLAYIESGQTELHIEDVNLLKLLNDSQSSLDVLANTRGIDIRIDDVKEDQFICADYLRIKQVLLNLISNAIKYNRDNGLVTITAEEITKDKLRISISDIGHGIPANKLSELFKPFSRLGAELTSIEGTGIGLVVCTDLVTLMGGAIGVESSVGEGSTFWVELPLAAHQIEHSIESNSELSSTVEGASSIIEGAVLYVEDNLANISLLKSLIKTIDGVHLSTAQTGVEGIKIARTISPDIILLDINLPDMSGYDVIKELRQYEETKRIPTLAMSAAATKEDIEKGIAAGFQQYLTKPINIHEVIEVIKNNIERGQSSTEA
ncbi:MAG: ATP-binding protein [Colwellia sp.]|nr:ATP-binding protein [Colwellia sp.]